MASKGHERSLPACSCMQGRWKRSERRRNTMNVHLLLDLAYEGGGGGGSIDGVETTSISLWHAREVELVKMASKSHESPPLA
jgi:hypothetical protein